MRRENFIKKIFRHFENLVSHRRSSWYAKIRHLSTMTRSEETSYVLRSCCKSPMYNISPSAIRSREIAIRKNRTFIESSYNPIGMSTVILIAYREVWSVILTCKLWWKITLGDISIVRVFFRSFKKISHFSSTQLNHMFGTLKGFIR